MNFMFPPFYFECFTGPGFVWDSYPIFWQFLYSDGADGFDGLLPPPAKKITPALPDQQEGKQSGKQTPYHKSSPCLGKTEGLADHIPRRLQTVQGADCQEFQVRQRCAGSGVYRIEPGKGAAHHIIAVKEKRKEWHGQSVAQGGCQQAGLGDFGHQQRQYQANPEGGIKIHHYTTSKPSRCHFRTLAGAEEFQKVVFKKTFAF